MKKLSDFIRKMMKESDVSVSDAAECIGCGNGTFRNKLTQDRFSVENLIVIAELCGYKLTFVPDDDKKESEPLTVNEYVNNSTIQYKVNKYKDTQVIQSIDTLKAYIQQKYPEKDHQLTIDDLFDDLFEIAKKNQK